MRTLRFLILSGPTREYIDPVRYLSNASSGRQGIALAEAARDRGHEVDLVQGPVSLPPPAGVLVHPVTSALEMLARAEELHESCDVLIGAAAVSDYRPAETSEKKHKRSGDSWTLELIPNPDILERLGSKRGHRVHIGFALESEKLVENAARKLEKKQLCWIVANSPAAIGSESAEYTLLSRDGEPEPLGSIDKQALARTLIERAEASAAANRA